MPLSFTATQSPPLEHEIATPAEKPPENTFAGLDHIPTVHEVAAPLRPMTEHCELDAQEIE
jgi:hypothetical protein